MTLFLLIRHGANDTVGKSIAGRMPGIHLNTEGTDQATRLAERVSKQHLDAIYTSPMERTLETARAIAERVGLDAKIDDALVEINYGEWTGKSLEQLADDERWKRFNQVRSLTRVPGGEHILEIQARVVAEMERLREIHPGATLALVTHGDVIRAALAYYGGIALDLVQRYEIGCTSVTAISVEDYGARILKVNDTGE